jgi:translation elongation factor EF-G
LDTATRVKPSSSASLLHVAGATTRWGKVDEGTTVTDYDEDSIARKISLNNNFAISNTKTRKSI